jgi:hypothetical protein
VPGVDYAVFALSNADGDLAGADCRAKTPINTEVVDPDALDYAKTAARAFISSISKAIWRASPERRSQTAGLS